MTFLGIGGVSPYGGQKKKKKKKKKEPHEFFFHLHTYMVLFDLLYVKGLFFLLMTNWEFS
jgi:quinol-cytochrome oxidoreductase complex cytochrome b subunit